MYIDNHWTDEFKDIGALLRARMSRLPQASLPDPAEPLNDPARDAIVRDFLAAVDLSDPDAGERIAELAVDYACDYTPDGNPYRWSPIAAELFLVDWLPRKALLDAGEIRAVPEVMKAWVAFALANRAVPAHLIEETKEAVDEHAAAFRSAATDQASFGPAKALANAMMASGVDLSDQAAGRRVDRGVQPASLPRTRPASRPLTVRPRVGGSRAWPFWGQTQRDERDRLGQPEQQD